MFKYCWYWKKSKPNGWQHAKNKPMTAIEEVCVFSKASMGHVSQLGDRRMIYNPQGIKSIGTKKVTAVAHGTMMGARPNQVGKEYEAFTGFPHNVSGLGRSDYEGKIYDKKYPETILHFSSRAEPRGFHPTQKPVALFEYLIKTYTNEGETVLDNCMGSGTTAVACINTNRNYIGFELSEEYCKIAEERIGAVTQGVK